MRKDMFLQLLRGRVGNIRNPEDIEMLALEVSLAQEVELELNGLLKPWFLESEAATAETVPGESRLELPKDFIGEVEESEMYVFMETAQKFKIIDKDTYDRLSVEYFERGQGRPEKYAITGEYYRLFPTPDAIYTLQQRYYERDVAFVTVSDTGENRWMKYASDLLMAVGGMQYASKHLQNPNLTATFQPDIERAWSRLQRENERRKHANMSYVMGDGYGS